MKKKILVLDDQENHLKLVRESLGKANYESDGFKEEQKALNYLIQNPDIDAMIVDFQLFTGGMDASHFILTLEKDSYYKKYLKIPKILVTNIDIVTLEKNDNYRLIKDKISDLVFKGTDGTFAKRLINKLDIFFNETTNEKTYETVEKLEKNMINSYNQVYLNAIVSKYDIKKVEIEISDNGIDKYYIEFNNSVSLEKSEMVKRLAITIANEYYGEKKKHSKGDNAKRLKVSPSTYSRMLEDLKIPENFQIVNNINELLVK